jgi:hypothetical protein
VRLKSATATLLVCGSLVLVPAVPAAHARASETFHGIRVMPGGVVVDDRIVYAGGDIVVVPSVGRSFDSCPAGYVCLFADVNWGGSLVAFNTCCAWNNLSGYGFNETASSWRNRLNVDAQIAINAGGGGSKLCLGNSTSASSMPSGWDNAASSIRVRDSGAYC